MSSHPDPEFEISLDDDEGDRLMAKADALIHRHTGFAVAPDADDLPVLTDVVDDRLEPFIGDAEPITLEPGDAEPIIATPDATATANNEGNDLAERLVALDTVIGRHIEQWVTSELPQIISRELDEFAERLHTQAAAHLRASLLPLISAEIADTLDDKPEA